MIKNNKIYGFQTGGKIFYTKNGENVPSVLFHEFAHIYANNLLEQPRESDTAILDDLENTAKEILGNARIAELVDSDIRYQPLIQELFKKNDEARYDYAREVFATAMGELFKKIQNNIKPDIKTFPKQVKELTQKEYGENVAEKAFNVANTLCEGFKFENKNTDAMEIRKKADEYSNEEEKRIAFEEGAKWALKQSGIKVEETETKVETKIEEKVETPKEKKPKKATAKKSTGKPKKATKKATEKVEDKPTFDVGDEFDNGWLIVEYLGKGKYKIIDNDANELVKTEKEIDEA
jgi:hypothetical protein